VNPVAYVLIQRNSELFSSNMQVLPQSTDWMRAFILTMNNAESETEFIIWMQLGTKVLVQCARLRNRAQKCWCIGHDYAIGTKMLVQWAWLRNRAQKCWCNGHDYAIGHKNAGAMGMTTQQGTKVLMQWAWLRNRHKNVGAMGMTTCSFQHIIISPPI